MLGGSGQGSFQGVLGGIPLCPQSFPPLHEYFPSVKQDAKGIQLTRRHKAGNASTQRRARQFFIPSQVSVMGVDPFLSSGLHRRKTAGSRKVFGGVGNQGPGQLWESGWQEPMGWLALGGSKPTTCRDQQQPYPRSKFPTRESDGSP